MISTLSMVTAQGSATQEIEQRFETQLSHEVEQDLRSSFRQTYHEIADRHVSETDGAGVIEQLRANLAQLEDLHGRMQFMMTEVKYLLKKT